MVKCIRAKFQEDSFMVLKKISLIYLLSLLIFISQVLAQQGQQLGNAKLKLAEIDTTIWKYLAAPDRSQWIITKADSERAYREYAIPGYNILKTVHEISDKIGKKKLAIEQETSNLISLLEQVMDYFEEGLRLNPFENYFRNGLVTTYTNLLKFQKEPTKQLQMLQNLLYLKKNSKDRLDYYHNIGMIYGQYEMWELARDNFQFAVEVIFEGDESTMDTTKLFENLYWRGYAQFRLYEAEPSLTSFMYARMIAPKQDLYEELTNHIDFINWDGGNIRAREKYNEALRLKNEKKYDEAEIVFLELLGMVTTEKATNEAQLALAKMQFNSLNKEDEAIDRMWNVVNKYPLDTGSGTPIDSAYQYLWDEYAQMCLLMGVNYFNTNKKLSFAYLLKASQIEGSSKGQAFLNLAMVSSENPQLCIDYSTKALEYQDQLRTDDKKSLYETIYKAYLKKGDFVQALKWFRKLYELSS